MGLHALGTAGVLFTESYAGFQVAIPVGLLVSAFFAAGAHWWTRLSEPMHSPRRPGSDPDPSPSRWQTR